MWVISQPEAVGVICSEAKQYPNFPSEAYAESGVHMINIRCRDGTRATEKQL